MCGKVPKMLGLGFCTNLAQIFLCFFLAFIFQREEIITLILGTVFYADFGAQIFAQIFAQILCADFVRRFLRRFFVRDAQIIAQIFAQIFRRFFFGVLALQK